MPERGHVHIPHVASAGANDAQPFLQRARILIDRVYDRLILLRATGRFRCKPRAHVCQVDVKACLQLLGAVAAAGHERVQLARNVGHAPLAARSLAVDALAEREQILADPAGERTSC